MTAELARDFAKKARKAVPSHLHEFARNLEQAVGVLADEIDAIRAAADKPVRQVQPAAIEESQESKGSAIP